MTDLVLDFGNTRIKAACFEDGKLADVRFFDNPDALLKETLFIGACEKIILSSVTNDHVSFLEEWQSLKPITVFNNDLKLPLKNRYKSPETLGSDRLLASVGAYAEFPDKSVLTIDFGTCIKYNFTNSANEFLGGAISPGIRMRYKALHEFTEKLPLQDTNFYFDELIGTDTAGSLHSGVITATLEEVKGMMAQYRLKFPGLVTVFTGGDYEFFVKRLKSSIFADPHLVMKGLHYVLNYQLEN